MELAYYWSSIPIGPENAITYEQLCFKWHVSRRHVRRILHELSMWDNGDGFVLIRSSQYVGFYRTDDRAEIERFKRDDKQGNQDVRTASEDKQDSRGKR